MKPQQQGNLRTVSITVVSRYHSTHSALGANSHHAVPWCDAAVYRTDVLSLLLCVCCSFNIWMFSSRYENTKWLILCLGSAAWARYWQTGNPWTALTLILFCDSYFNWFSNISVLSCIRKRTIDVLYCWQSTLIGFIFFILQTHCLMKWLKLFEMQKCLGVVFYTDVYIETNHCNNCNSF